MPTPRATSSRRSGKYPFAYTYRDYVIRSFNADLPFDRFCSSRSPPTSSTWAARPRPLAAMGFLTVGRRFLNDQNEIIDDRIDLVGRGLLGLSLGCARCHDHKFDPIPSEDYYSLYGVFASSVEPDELPRLERPGERPSPRPRRIEPRDRQGPQGSATISWPRGGPSSRTISSDGSRSI